MKWIQQFQINNRLLDVVIFQGALRIYEIKHSLVKLTEYSFIFALIFFCVNKPRDDDRVFPN